MRQIWLFLVMNVLFCQSFLSLCYIKVVKVGKPHGLIRLFSKGTDIHRIERILANRGVGSRKEVAAMLKQGRIKVKGKVVRSSAERFPSNIDILVDDSPIEEVLLISSISVALLIITR